MFQQIRNQQIGNIYIYISSVQLQFEILLRNLCHLIGGYTKHSQIKIEFVNPFTSANPVFRFGADLPNLRDPRKPVPALFFSVVHAKKPVSQQMSVVFYSFKYWWKVQFLLFWLVYILDRFPYMVDKQVMTEQKHLVLRTTVWTWRLATQVSRAQTKRIFPRFWWFFIR